MNPAIQPLNSGHQIYIIAAWESTSGISKEEAGQLTMTEFQLMLIAKYPEQKGYTCEEYDHAADDATLRAVKAQTGAMMEQERTMTSRTEELTPRLTEYPARIAGLYIRLFVIGLNADYALTRARTRI